MTPDVKARLVNALTFARVPLIFAWLVLAVAQEFAPGGARGLALAVAACAMMLLSGLTDAWDGHLARKWNVVTTLGKMSDPLMDKVFYIVAFPALSWQVMHQGESEAHGLVMMSFTILYMLRDTWVTFMRMVGARYGADVAAAWLGKVRTALSFPAAGWVYVYCCFHRMAPAPWWRPWLWSCYAVEGLLILLTVWSLVTYTLDYLPYLRRGLLKDG
ncbi:MAG: CDP-alcohol phosphatidyltransferase family protein [Kiritimatiellae bacterium]|nr:CDP-alcohol phosphatidyltransferase family protein [Kiritimatiellia bacterium]